MNVGNTAQDVFLFEKSTDLKEYKINIDYNILKVQIESTVDSPTFNILLEGRTSKFCKYEKMLAFSDSTWKLENTLTKVGIYTFDVLGYSDVILKVVSTDAPLTCHIMEMKE